MDPAEKTVKNISTRMGHECVLKSILYGDKEPTDLPLDLLKGITKDFSEDRIIGHGGFGVVYKGVKWMDENRVLYTVAVKRIHININTIDDKSFRTEVTSLMKTKHENVVRFLGFCSNTHRECMKHPESGEMNLVNVNVRLLCLEYISNGSLDKFITDELRGLQWEMRYKIITGICKGLHYLHKEKNIIHMDLKPGNILLDGKNMVPKITDFGLSRPNKNTHTMAVPVGTSGYIAPEYRENSKTTTACDIYSLGAIIAELVTGGMAVPNKHNVLRRWRHRWNKPPTPLQYRQVIRSIEIAGLCRELIPGYRPSIDKIIDLLSESTCGQTDQEISTYIDDDMLGIEPLELYFNKEMSWSVKLTNKTKACFAFEIERPSHQYTIWPDKGIVPPECEEYLVQITLQPHERASQVQQHADKFVVQSTVVINGFSVEEITESTFHKEASKVVDEVNLMVVYEPAKPLKRSRSTEDTKMPAEEVAEEKKRTIVGPASGKGKNKLCGNENEEATSTDINSSERGKYTQQQDRRILHPPEKFSHSQATNMTYLVTDSDRARDVTRGAMGSLLHKLGVLDKEYNLKTSVEEDAEKLLKMQQVLRNVSSVHQANPDDLVKRWACKVREMSYDMEDFVDDFLVHRESDSDRSVLKELTHEMCFLLDKDKSHQQIGNLIKQHISEQVQRADEDGKGLKVENIVHNAYAKVDIEDPRISGIYIDRDDLIGIEAPKTELTSLLEGGIDKLKLKIVSIVGMGGLGKTTLAHAVYDSHQKSQYYTITAFIPVGQNPNIPKLLKNILYACGKKDTFPDNLEVELQKKELYKFLENKRYFIVIDDIWNSLKWNGIRSAFPDDKNGSRVMTTTRDHRVALLCCESERKYVYEIRQLGDEDSRRLFFARLFDREKDCHDIPKKEKIIEIILKRCGGMPLAINSIARLLAGEPYSTWENVGKSLAALTDGKTEETSIDIMKQILDLSYMHLSDDLKTCLLYVCKYPEEYEICKIDLLRQWVAEGFVRRMGMLDAEDVAENNFKALVNMCMIQPEKIDYNNEVLSCRVHDIILELLRSKSSEDNFIQVIDGLKDVARPRENIRRVSAQYSDDYYGTNLQTIKSSLSHVRSVSLFRGSLVSFFLKFKFIRVLHVQHEHYQKGIDLTSISSLFLLRFLKIACSRQAHYDLKLPDQIGQLQQLQTIDIDGGRLKNYPSDIVNLPWLLHLICGGDGIPLPEGIHKLKSLRTLVGVCVYKSSVDSINGLGMLTNLRRLQINSNERGQPKEAMSMRMAALRSSICKLSASLRILNLGEESLVILDVRGWMKSLFRPGSNIRELDLGCCNFQSCPQWIGLLDGLYKLTIMVREVADSIIIVSRLPSLAYLGLFTGNKANDETVAVPGTSALQSLKHLIFHCPRASLTFETGAVPKLEKLEILFRYHMARRFVPAGIDNLQADILKKISLTVDFNDRKVKGSKHWNEHDWRTYHESEEYHADLWYHTSSLRRMLKRAFTKYHPRVVINFEEGFKDDKYEDDDKMEDDYIDPVEEDDYINPVEEDDTDEDKYEDDDDDKMEDDYIDVVEEDDNEEDNDEQDDIVRPFHSVPRERIDLDYILKIGEFYGL